MRRRPGIQGLQRTAQARDVYKTLGKTVQDTRLEHMRAQMASFKEHLEEFALKHRHVQYHCYICPASHHQAAVPGAVHNVALPHPARHAA